jgi:hypothetical protein
MDSVIQVVTYPVFVIFVGLCALVGLVHLVQCIDTIVIRKPEQTHSPELKWTTTHPSVEGWYWIRASNLTPRVDKFVMNKSIYGYEKCYCPYRTSPEIHGSYEYAGPIPEPK